MSGLRSFWQKWLGHDAKAASVPASVTSSSVMPLKSSSSVATIVHGPGDTMGFFERAYDRERRTVELRYAFRENLPAWMTDVGVPLVPGKGTPTSCYMTLRALRQLGVGFGEARAFIIRSVHEVESVAHLDWLRVRHPHSPLGELAKQTHIFQYAETSIVQSGHRVVMVRVDAAHAMRKPLGDLLTYYELLAIDSAAKRSQHDAVLRKYERTRTDEVLVGYDVHIEVEAYR